MNVKEINFNELIGKKIYRLDDVAKHTMSLISVCGNTYWFVPQNKVLYGLSINIKRNKAYTKTYKDSEPYEIFKIKKIKHKVDEHVTTITLISGSEKIRLIWSDPIRIELYQIT